MTSVSETKIQLPAIVRIQHPDKQASSIKNKFPKHKKINHCITVTTYFYLHTAREMNKNEIDRILTNQVENNKTPSVQYVIFKTDSIIHQFQLGYADISNKLNVNQNTTYNAYSVTKTFTALSILQLNEQNKLDINQPIKNYLHEFPYSAEITIKQLLTHTSGIPNPIPVSWIHLTEEHDSFDRNRFFDQIFHKYNKTQSKPDEKFAYSNLGYVLLGQLIERVSGSRYEDYVRENIIKPLNIALDELNFHIPDLKNHAKPYQKKISFLNFILGFLLDKSKYVNKTEGKWLSFNNCYVNSASYGGLIGTSGAFVKYLQELLKPKTVLITDVSKELLFKENFINKNKATGMCLSWFSGQLNGNKYFTHAGGGGGYYCEIRIYPSKSIGSVIMFNRTGIADERYLDNLDKFILSDE